MHLPLLHYFINALLHAHIHKHTRTRAYNYNRYDGTRDARRDLYADAEQRMDSFKMHIRRDFY